MKQMRKLITKKSFYPDAQSIEFAILEKNLEKDQNMLDKLSNRHHHQKTYHQDRIRKLLGKKKDRKTEQEEATPQQPVSLSSQGKYIIVNPGTLDNYNHLLSNNNLEKTQEEPETPKTDLTEDTEFRIPAHNQPVTNYRAFVNSGNQKQEIIVDQLNPTQETKQIANTSVTSPFYGESDDKEYFDQYGAVVTKKEDIEGLIRNGGTFLSSDQDLVNYRFDGNKLGTDSHGDLSFSDVETLVELLSSVAGMYTHYFEIMPHDKTINPDDKKDFWEKSLQILNFYKKISNFVRIVTMDRVNLMNDLNFLKTKIYKLKANEEDMLKFYGYEGKYYRSKIGSVIYQEKDPKFKDYFLEITTVTIEFNNGIRRVFRETFNLLKFNDYFEDSITRLSDFSNDNQIAMVLQKIDQVLMILLRLDELKEEIFLSVENIKTSLLNLQRYQIKIKEILERIENLIDYYKNGLDKIQPLKVQEEKKSSKKLWLSVACFMLVLI